MSLGTGLPDDLSGDDVVIDCRTVKLHPDDVENVVIDIVLRRHARSLRLLGPAPSVSEAVGAAAARLDVLDRIVIEYFT